MESNNIDGKKYIILMIIAFLLNLVGFILVMMFMADIAGVEVLFGENTSKMWILVVAIPLIIGTMMMRYIPIMKQRKEEELYRNSENTSETSPEHSTRGSTTDYQKIRIQNIIMGFLVVFFGMLIVYFILGKSRWAEFINAII